MINLKIAEAIESSGAGVIALQVSNNSDFGIYVQTEPKENPINCITVYSTSGASPIRTYTDFIENNGIQIRVRSANKNLCYNKMKEVVRFLDASRGGLISTSDGIHNIVAIKRRSPILDLSRIEDTDVNFYIYTVNYDLIDYEV